MHKAIWSTGPYGYKNVAVSAIFKFIYTKLTSVEAIRFEIINITT